MGALKFWWQEDDGWIPVIPLTTVTLTLGADGTAGGAGGCNDYTVPYAGDLQIEKVMEATDTYAELPALTFGPVSAQMVACEEPEGIMQQEQGYFVSLGATAYYFKLGGLLMLLDADGIPRLMFAAQD
jgi:heat shock protein HslJ